MIKMKNERQKQVLKIYSKDVQLQVLDIGTGSGCILLSILKERSNFYGTGIDISIKDLAYLIKEIVGYDGDFVFNLNKPVGAVDLNN